MVYLKYTNYKMEYLDLVNENDEVIGKEDRDIIYKKRMEKF